MTDSKKKKSSGKRVLLVAAIVVVVVIMTVSIISLYLGNVVKGAAESMAPEILGVEVTIGDVDVSLLGSSGELHDIIIANPEGYSGSDAMRVKKVTADIALSSLLAGSVSINSFTVDGVELHCESGNGKSNIGEIIDNTKSYAGMAEPAADGEAASDNAEGSAAPEGSVPLGLQITSGKVENTTITFINRGSEIKGPVVKVGRVNISLTGDVLIKNIKDVTVSNPPGFSDNNAAEVDTVVVKINASSLFGDETVIPEITVDGVRAIYEGSVRQSNITHIQNYIDEFARSVSSGSESAERPMMVNDFYLKNARARLSTSMLKGMGVPMPVPNMHLTDVRGSNGADLLRALLSPVTNTFQGAGKGLLGGLKAVGGSATEGLGEIGTAAGEGLKAAGETAGDGVKGIVGGLKNLNPFSRKTTTEEE